MNHSIDKKRNSFRNYLIDSSQSYERILNTELVDIQITDNYNARLELYNEATRVRHYVHFNSIKYDSYDDDRIIYANRVITTVK